jgi:hypothetical protein
MIQSGGIVATPLTSLAKDISRESLLPASDGIAGKRVEQSED